jgi:AraC-like DNA-binding protein
MERARARVPERSSVVERLAQERLATELLGAFRLPSSGEPGRVSALVARTLAASTTLRPGRVPSAPVRLARELAERRFREPLALGEIAEEVGMHPVSLARAFRRVHGESFGAFVRRLRVREAYRLLAGGSAPVADVAQAAGFFDQAHLARVFRAFVGVSPGQLRDLARTSPDARES